MKEGKIYKSLGDEDSNKQILLDNPYVIVKVGHDRCPPCVRLTQAVENSTGPYILLDLDVNVVNRYADLAGRSFPKWVLVEKGEIVMEQAGYGGDPDVVDYIQKVRSQDSFSKAPELAAYVKSLLSEE